MTLAEAICGAIMALSMPNADTACKHMDTVVEASKRYNVDPVVMTALIHTESRWTPRAVSRHGACGFTQILPKYTKRFYGGQSSCEDLFDPRLSIYKGADILGYHLKRYRRSYNRSLCSYNAGARRCRPGIAKNKGHRYARKIMRLTRKIKRNMRYVHKDI